MGRPKRSYGASVLFASDRQRRPDKTNSVNYIIITAVKDEERFIEQTLGSVVRQTRKPLLWVIVDDGSNDRTPDVIQRFAAVNPFIRLIRSHKRTARQTGTAEVHAFNIGFKSIGDLCFDLVVKLDGDLSFEADYFEKLLRHFEHNPRLGIASGGYLEESGDDWTEISMPFYHAAGAAKAIRRECFEEISGFITQRGWDMVDEIRAINRGWKTGHFRELRMRHLKPEGSGMGQLRTAFMHGEIYYRTGGSAWLFPLKVASRLLSRPFLLGGLALACGYVRMSVQRAELLVSESEKRSYQELLKKRFLAVLRGTNLAS